LVGGKSTGDAGAVCQAGGNAADLFVRGGDNALWHTSLPLS
jgi:hypothetical protein